MSADPKYRFENATAASQRFLSPFLRSVREIFRDVATLVESETDDDGIAQTINSHGVGLCRVQPQN